MVQSRFKTDLWCKAGWDGSLRGLCTLHPRIDRRVLGYSMISITLDAYSHVLADLQKEAVKAMEDPIDYLCLFAFADGVVSKEVPAALGGSSGERERRSAKGNRLFLASIIVALGYCWITTR